MVVDHKAIAAYKRRRERRLDERGCGEPDREDYGTASSGNWGHAGREGLRGGSSPGGGGAFRMVKGGKQGGFSSKAKIQSNARKKMTAAKRGLAKAQASGNAEKIAKAQAKFDKQKAHNSKINMHRKSIKDLKASGRFDPNASKNILADKNRSKTAHERHVANVSGTSTAIKHTFNGTKKRWGGGGKGGSKKKKK